ncbi:MAG: hypothetical protein ABI655_02895 [Phenylobacterium sp.]
MPLPQLLPPGLLLALLLSPVAAQAFPDPGSRAYEAALARQCPAKHLEWLNPGILAEPMEDFVEALPHTQKALAARTVARECAHVEVGASCGDHAVIHAAAKLKLTSRLAMIVCRETYACTAPYDCHETR